MSTPPTVGITGARGYVGSVVASALTDAGLDVVELVRVLSDLVPAAQPLAPPS